MSKKSGCLKFLDRLSENSRKTYMGSIRKYESFHGMTIEELVCEALDEQTNQVPPHMLSIIDRLEDFQNNLIESNYVYGTVVNHMVKVKSVYHKNRVQIPYIEPINAKRVKRREYIGYEDVLTKHELKKALSHMRLPSKARALTMIQGGLSNEECEHLTLRAFIDDTYKYHQKSNDVDALKWLEDEDHPIIWVTKLIRVKTQKPYYAVIGAEAVNTIASAKLYELQLPKNNGVIPNKLLNTHKLSFNRVCDSINKKLGLGKVAEENKLKPHNLRRFHATHIKGSVLNYEENSLISNSEIDELQGRGKTATQDTYIKSNPIQQKCLYAKVMNNVSLYHKYDYKILDGDVVVFIKDQESENRKLSLEVEKLNVELQKKRVASEKVQKLKDELGDEGFRELVGEILSAS